MPHYKDGSEAKVGDQVFGKLYNTEGLRAGTIISITPGVESCNAMVQFTEAVPAEEDGAPTPRMAVLSPEPDGSNKAHCRTMKGEKHGSAGPQFMLFACADYCAVNELTKVGPVV